MSDEQLPVGDQPSSGTQSAVMILVRIAIMFAIVPMAIMWVAKYLF